MEEPVKPAVIVYGDNENLNIKQLVWALLSGRDFLLVTPANEAELKEHMTQAALVILHINGPEDPLAELADEMTNDPQFVGTILGIGISLDVKDRLILLSHGFESAFNYEMMEDPLFRAALIRKFDKAVTRIDNRTKHEEYERFKGAIAASPDAFIIFDENNKLFFASDHYIRAYPINGDKIYKGMDVLEAFELLAQEQNVDETAAEYEYMKIFWETLEGQIEFQLHTGHTWRITARQLPGDLGSIVTTTDISMYRKQQIELTQKQQDVEQALQKEKEASNIQKQFINMVSHEFRTPLSIIDGNAQILRRRGTDLDAETLEKRTRIIRSAVARLVHMMEDVLSSNMLKTGRFELNREPISLYKTLQDICDEFTDLSTLHTIDYKLHEIPEMAILDRKVLTLTLSNLLSNAVRYSDNDTVIEVDAWLEGNELCLAVADEGLGIAEHEHDKVFDPYYRGESASNIAGTGIGLNLVKRLVEMHNGRIFLESEIGKGATFTVTIPIEPYEADNDEGMDDMSAEENTGQVF